MELTANAIQTVAVNQALVFSDTVNSGNCAILHREGSGLVTLRGLQNGQCRARFLVTFSGNIAVPTGQTVGPISLAIAINGEAIQSTTATVTPTAVDAYNNVSTFAYVDVPIGCCSQVSVQNISTIPVNVVNANLAIVRVQ